MATLDGFLRTLTRGMSAEALADQSDRQLVEQFLARPDTAAFDALVRRHGAMVYRVCWRVLQQPQDAEDAFQAAFLVLARRLHTVRKHESLASWLHGVARRVALKAQATAATRRRHEELAGVANAAPPDALTWHELRTALDDELARLPEKWRLPLVLCYLEGRTQDEAARHLGWSRGTLQRRLDEGRAALGRRLTGRGVGWPAALSAVLVVDCTTTLAPRLLGPTADAAASVAAGQAASTVVSPNVAALTEEVVTAMSGSKLKVTLAALVFLAAVGMGAGGFAPTTPTVAPPSSGRGPQAADTLPRGATGRMGTDRFRHDSWVESLAVTADGKALLAGSGLSIRVWDRASGKELRRLANELQVRTVKGSSSAPRYTRLALSPDGKTLAVGTQGVFDVNYEILLLDQATGRELRRLGGHTRWVGGLAFSPDGKLLASCGGDNAVRVWDPAKGTLAFELKEDKWSVCAVAFSPDGKHLATADNDAADVRLWDVSRRAEVSRLHGLNGPAWAVAFSPVGKLLATAGDAGELVLWDATTGKEARRLRGHEKTVGTVAFSPDGKLVASGSHDKTLRVWDAATGAEVRRVGGHASSVYNVGFLDGGTTVANWGSENTIRFWDPATGRERETPAGHRVGVKAVAVAPDGKTLATGAADSTVRIWDTTTQKELRRLRTDGDVAALAYAPDGKAVASAGYDGTVRVWDPATGRELLKFKKGGWVTAVAFSPNGMYLAAGGEGGWLTVWDAQTGKEVRTFTDYYNEGMGPSMAFAPDGATVAYACRDGFGAGGIGIVRLADVATGKGLRRFRAGINAGVTALRFSPDGRTLLTGGLDHTVRLFEVATGAERRILRKSNPKVACTVNAVTYSPDGRLAAAVADEPDRVPRIRVWDVIAGTELPPLEGHTGPVTSLAFSADGKTLATGSSDTTALIWDAGRLAVAKPAALKPADRDAHWAALASEDAGVAYGATCALVLAGADVVPFLADRLRPLAAADDKVVARLIADLESDAFKVRDKAGKELADLGPAAERQLRTALATNPPAETRQRLQKLVDQYQGEALRTGRVLEVLELIGGDKAAAAVRPLARGAADPAVVRDAEATLGRLARKRTAP